MIGFEHHTLTELRVGYDTFKRKILLTKMTKLELGLSKFEEQFALILLIALKVILTK